MSDVKNVDDWFTGTGWVTPMWYDAPIYDYPILFATVNGDGSHRLPTHAERRHRRRCERAKVYRPFWPRR